MATDSKGPAPGSATRTPERPGPGHGRVVTLRKATILGALAALLVGVLSASGAIYLVGGPTDELDRRAEALTVQADGLTVEVDGLTADVEALTAQADSLTVENADLADTLAGVQTQAGTLARENAALRTRVTDMTEQQPVVADVKYGKVLKVDQYWTGGFSPTPDGWDLTDAFVLVVDVTVTNPDTDRDAYISSTQFRLKGPDGTWFPPAERSPVATTYGYYPLFLKRMPGGRLPLEYLTLGPSETAKASLLFYVSKPVTEFTISYPALDSPGYPPSWFDQRTTTALSL
jgi:hypothetical protein